MNRKNPSTKNKICPLRCEKKLSRLSFHWFDEKFCMAHVSILKWTRIITALKLAHQLRKLKQVINCLRYRKLQIFSPTFRAIDDCFAGLLLVIGARSTRLCRWFADLSRAPLFFHIILSVYLYTYLSLSLDFFKPHTHMSLSFSFHQVPLIRDGLHLACHWKCSRSSAEKTVRRR